MRDFLIGVGTVAVGVAAGIAIASILAVGALHLKSRSDLVTLDLSKYQCVLLGPVLECRKK